MCKQQLTGARDLRTLKDPLTANVRSVGQHQAAFDRIVGMLFAIRAERPAASELGELYASVGWSTYVEDRVRLKAAIEGSHLVLSARSDSDGTLLGLARTISDGHTIVYLQDLLVDRAHHREGKGGALLDEVLARSRGIRQFVLLTDAESPQRAFYESRQLVEVHDVRTDALCAVVRVT